MGCGSDWAFTAASALESLAMIKEVDTTIQEYPAKQIIDCDNKNYGCSGGWMRNAFEYTRLDGMVVASNYSVPYNGKQGECMFRHANSHFKNDGFQEYFAVSNEKMKEFVNQ